MEQLLKRNSLCTFKTKTPIDFETCWPFGLSSTYTDTESTVHINTPKMEEAFLTPYDFPRFYIFSPPSHYRGYYGFSSVSTSSTLLLIPHSSTFDYIPSSKIRFVLH